MTERRQISEKEKQFVLEHSGRRCFIDGAPIPEDEEIEFHHIKPYSRRGATNVENIAPVCRNHHRSIGTMSLHEYRDKLDIERFFESGEPRYLDDVIREKRGPGGEKVVYELEDGQIVLYLDGRRFQYPLYVCPVTDWKYFYAKVPVGYVENDRNLQPRALRQSSLWQLYRHFQINTQLAPSICRIDENGVLLLFDGQHKAAAQIWSGRTEIECKVYINPDPRGLKETNLEAHGKFRQMSFYSHELMKKYADIFGEDWEHYMETEGEKSEAGFFNYLLYAKKKTKAQARNEIALAMYNEILDDADNNLAQFLPEKNRSRKQPLSFSRLKKTLLAEMIVPPPVDDEFESDTDYRKQERRNLVKLMNIIAEEGLIERWDPERNDAAHKRAQRIFGAGAVRAWTTLLKDTINQHLRHYTEDERNRFFYRPMDESEFEYFRQFVQRLFSHRIWVDPDPTGEITARLFRDDATTAKSLFEEQGLSVHWLLGA